MVDLKKLSETDKKEELKAVTVPFMGGKAVISPGGSFESGGKIIEYDPKVKLGSFCDQKGQCDPKSFLSLVLTVSKNPEAISLLEKL